MSTPGGYPPFAMMPLEWKLNLSPIIGFALLALLLDYVPALIVFARRKHMHPISGRQPKAVIVFGVLAILWHTLLCVRFIFFDTMPCIFHVPLQRFAIEFFAHLYLYRLWMLYKEHHRTFEKKRYAKKKKANPLIEDDVVPAAEAQGTVTHWLTSRSEKQILIILGVSCTLLIVVPTVVSVLLGLPPAPFPAGAARGCNIKPHYFFSLVELVIHSAIFVYFSFKFSHLDADNFKIKLEFQLAGSVMILNVIATIVIGLTPKLAVVNAMQFPIQLFPVMFGVFVCFITGVNLPIFLSAVSPSRMKRSNTVEMEEQLDFGRILSIPEGFRAFYQFLSREFAIENLLFWQAAVQFRDQVDEGLIPTRSLLDTADTLVSLYFANESPLELNVPSDTLSTVKSAMKHAQSLGDNVTYPELRNIFVKAEEDIFKLMLHDPFPRFRQSPELQAVTQQLAVARERDAMYDTNKRRSMQLTD